MDITEQQAAWRNLTRLTTFTTISVAIVPGPTAALLA